MESGFNKYITVFGGDRLNGVIRGGMGIISLNVFCNSSLFFLLFTCLLPDRFGILIASEHGCSIVQARV